ncbi:MAG: signal peptide peptidase SppA, partial [Candidatus Aminicenantes bacterium]|nr:signal peptide peptidase SppA [Candidatus Aminicenantes bacterium]
YEDEFMDLVRGDSGKIARLPHAVYSQIKPSTLGLDKGRKIALIYGMGPIHTGEGSFQSMGSTTVARWFRQVRTDKSIEAVVFRIDSPGGSVVASDIIWREVWLTRKEKPVIVTMSDMAGSGGYWIAMHANRIFAQPQTLTGSIGIIFGKFNMMRLYEKIGVTSESLLFGRNANMFSSFARFRPDVRTMVREEMRQTYNHFIAQVADGRGMSEEDVGKIAKGRVWTGQQAQKLGLVDEMGGLSEAIAAAKELAGIPDDESVRLVVLPRDYSLFDVLYSAFSSRSSRFPDARFQKLLTIFKALKDEPRWALMPLLFGPQ